MFEIAGRLLVALDSGERFAVATAIDVLGSSPHGAGTSMAVGDAGSVVGSVSGGCVETAALDGCARLLRTGLATTARFGFGDEAAARAGLSCGGELDVVFHPVDQEVRAELTAAAAGRSAAVAVVTAAPRDRADLVGRTVGVGADSGDLNELPAAFDGLPGLSMERLRAAVRGRLDTGTSGAVELACGGSVLRLFVEVAVPAATFVVVGATEYGRALAQAATALGYAVTVVDHRPAFVGSGRVPGVVVHGWPHQLIEGTALDRRSVVCVMSHDEELDPLTIAAALAGGAGYVGVLGARSTHARRVERLVALGVPQAEIDRLHAPIGLDIGASSAAETAVSIMAEVLVARTGGSADSLRDRTGPIHWAAARRGAIRAR